MSYLVIEPWETLTPEHFGRVKPPTQIVHVREPKRRGFADVTVIREDLAYGYGAQFPMSGKNAAMVEIVNSIAAQGDKRLSIFAKAASVYAEALPVLCKPHSMEAIIYFAANSMEKTPEWLRRAQARGARIELLRPNMITINVAQARSRAYEEKSRFIPFGLDCSTAVNAFSKTLVFHRKVGTLVLSTCSGITLAGLLRGYRLRKQRVPEIVAVSCGRKEAEIRKSIAKYERIPDRVRFVDSYALHEVPELVDGPKFPLHQEYEVKAWHWLTEHVNELQRPIHFLNLGV